MSRCWLGLPPDPTPPSKPVNGPGVVNSSGLNTSLIHNVFHRLCVIAALTDGLVVLENERVEPVAIESGVWRATTV
jgi:hypothetical protein